MNVRKLRAVVMVCACVAVIAVFGCKGTEVKTEDPKQVEKVTVEEEQVVVNERPANKKKVVRPVVLDERHRYEAYVGVKVRDFDKRLEEAKARAIHSSGRTKERNERDIREMERKVAEMKQEYEKMKASQGESWQKARAKVDVAIDDVENE